MIQSGLVSITFRKLSAEEVLDLVQKAGLKAIEWGGDIHVPHGDVARAEDIKAKTAQAGIAVAAYGSYYRLGVSEQDGLPFADVLASAKALGAPLIRVWAGNKGSADADAAFRKAATEDALRIADMAAEENIKIGYEWHGGTLTDTLESAQQLLAEADHPNLWTYWQPPVGLDPESCLKEIEAILPKLIGIHTFHWHKGEDGRPVRHVLADGDEVWPSYFEALGKCERDLFAMVEFVLEDEPNQLVDDARVLKGWLWE